MMEYHLVFLLVYVDMVLNKRFVEVHVSIVEKE
jgi:hypothetical protein